MKKSLIALAVMAAAGAASAQSSVTLFGIVDASVSRYLQHNGTYNTVLANSAYNSSRLGFRGTEDLGGGMAASFWLEAAMNNDNGSFGTSPPNSASAGSGGGGLTFGRRSTVSLSGNWGELRLGRDYVPTFWNITIFDPFGTNGVGSAVVHKVKLAGTAGTAAAGIVDPNYVRSSNQIAYYLPPNLGGIYGQLNYGFDEQTGQNEQGRYIGTRIGYGSGPFNVAIAYSRTEGANTLSLTAPDVRDWNIGGQWDFGMAKLMAQYDNAKYDTGAFDTTLKSWLVGALVPVGAGEIRVSYGRSKLDDVAGDPRVSQWALGYVHNLSKRTALYATYARTSNKGGADVPVGASLGSAAGVGGVTNQNGWGYDLGIRHSF
jgi:predicted porin